MNAAAATLRRLGANTSGLAMMEFAFILPVFLVMSLTGAELTNYIITKMRVSQLALHIADDAARIGTGSQLQQKSISELDINDLFTGADLQSGELNLLANGRVILTDIEPMPLPNTAKKFKIGWQRCYGQKTSHRSAYTQAGVTTNLDGVGPPGRTVDALDGNATMFVEVYYEYKPLVSAELLRGSTTFFEFASMAVRDRRDLTGGNHGIYNVEGVVPSTC